MMGWLLESCHGAEGVCLRWVIRVLLLLLLARETLWPTRITLRRELARRHVVGVAG